MIEGGIGPRRGVVAGFARRRERCCDMVHRRRCVVVIGLMARYAGGTRQVVIVVDVAIGTSPRRHGVHARQRESCRSVVKSRVRPCRGVVALIARLREVRSNVVGIRCALIVLQVASDASGAG